MFPLRVFFFAKGCAFFSQRLGFLGLELDGAPRQEEAADPRQLEVGIPVGGEEDAGADRALEVGPPGREPPRSAEISRDPPRSAEIRRSGAVQSSYSVHVVFV